MAGKICVYVRDVQHPADLYDVQPAWYPLKVSIFEAGSLGPLCWKQVTYTLVPLPYQGEFGRVAGEFEVPAGTYLVKGFGVCGNVVTQVAWVQVNDGETVSVNLVPTSVLSCVHGAIIGVALGTAIVQNRHVPIAEIAPEEVRAFEKAASALVAKLPKEPGIPLMSVEELRKRLAETPKG